MLWNTDLQLEAKVQKLNVDMYEKYDKLVKKHPVGALGLVPVVALADAVLNPLLTTAASCVERIFKGFINVAGGIFSSNKEYSVSRGFIFGAKAVAWTLASPLVISFSIGKTIYVAARLLFNKDYCSHSFAKERGYLKNLNALIVHAKSETDTIVIERALAQDGANNVHYKMEEI